MLTNLHTYIYIYIYIPQSWALFENRCVQSHIQQLQRHASTSLHTTTTGDITRNLYNTHTTSVATPTTPATATGGTAGLSYKASPDPAVLAELIENDPVVTAGRAQVRHTLTALYSDSTPLVAILCSDLMYLYTGL